MITNPRKDIIGNRYGRLTVMLDCGQDSRRHNLYLTICDCGESKAVIGSFMLNGKISSCGCLKRESDSKKFYKHGLIKDNEYSIWLAMRDRCSNPKSKNYKNYGARGITVSKEWDDYSVFIRDMGKRPDGYSIERIDNTKGYSKENCRWASFDEQVRNTRQNVNITYDGKTMCLTDWADELGLPRPTLHYRIHAGWDLEKALTKRK